MNAQPGLMDYLERAEDHLQQARACWNATNLESCGIFVEHLRQGAAAIESAQGAIGRGEVPAAAALARLESLRQNIQLLRSLINHAMAFHRGAALHTGMPLQAAVEEAATTELEG